MTGYAINVTQNGWRMVADEYDLLPGETWSETQPELMGLVKEKQLRLVDAACAGEITAGFTSSALGEPHTYPSDQNSQANLAANVLSSMYPDFKADWNTLQLCADASGAWVYRPHTAAQIQQVGLDGKEAILSCLTRMDARRKAINSAADVAAIQAVNW